MFIDTARINVKAGKGGDGAIAWRREKYEPNGGPSGGDGGDGGSIYLVASPDVRTLLDFKYKRKYIAENGEPGSKKNMFGKKGKDLYINLPVGTVVKEANSKKAICDLKNPYQKFLVAKGGKGGKGNARFANSTRQAPRFAEPGVLGREIDLLLEVKLIADIGFVGFPNVGKSSLLSELSEAKPKIANYHFTTLDPNLGVVKIDEGVSYVVADIPGLIEGASEGLGLGHDFLRHIERTRLICHVLDMSGSEARDPIDDYEKIRFELSNYSNKLIEREKLIIANKMDIEGANENLEKFKLKYPNTKIIETSAITRNGVHELKYLLWDLLKDIPIEYETLDAEIVDIETFFEKDPSIKVYRNGNIIKCEGARLKELVRRIIIDDEDSIQFFESRLEIMGVSDRIRELDPNENDIIDVEGFEFEWL